MTLVLTAFPTPAWRDLNSAMPVTFTKCVSLAVNPPNGASRLTGLSGLSTPPKMTSTKDSSAPSDTPALRRALGASWTPGGRPSPILTIYLFKAEMETTLICQPYINNITVPFLSAFDYCALCEGGLNVGGISCKQNFCFVKLQYRNYSVFQLYNPSGDRLMATVGHFTQAHKLNYHHIKVESLNTCFVRGEERNLVRAKNLVGFLERSSYPPIGFRDILNYSLASNS